jgi:hypothetical protein
MTTSNGFPGTPGMRFLDNGGGELIAGVRLPAGALIESLTINSCNTNPTLTINVSLLQFADPSGPATTIAFASVPANSGCGSTHFSLPNPPTVDNSGSTYMLDVSMQSGDETLAFRSVKVAYRLQVSPSPAVPTFNDVGMDDFGFQYIEALNATGIVGGCGENAFCPDKPLTRRQAAVLLAKALGLNFSN